MRDTRGRFLPGTSGNPKGRPRPSMCDRNSRIARDLALVDAATGLRLRVLDAGEISGLAYLSDAQLEILLHQARSLPPPGLAAETNSSASTPLP